MSPLERIIQELTSRGIEADFETLVARFTQNTGDHDPDAFLAFLEREGHISHPLSQELQSHSTLELTDFSSLATQFTLDIAPSPGPASTLEPSAPVSPNNDTIADEGPGPGVHLASVEPVAVAPRRYAFLESVGEGGMGRIDAVKDLDLRRVVAFKKMHVHRAHGLRAKRFLQEAQITAQLDHPNIVPVYSLEQSEEGTPAYTMKLIEGVTLEALIQELRDLPPPKASERFHEILEDVLKICDAMAYAHDKGVIHRDLKPENLMVGRYGEVYVMDWGIARILGVDEPESPQDSRDTLETEFSEVEAAHRTQHGSILGTPAYMPPEQAHGELHKIGPWTDVCALGLILHELFYLSKAYPGEEAPEILYKAIHGKRHIPPLHTTHTPSAELAAIIDCATHTETTERYDSMIALADDIRRYLRHEETVALPDTGWRRLRRAIAKRPRLVALFLVGTVLISAAIIAWSIYVERLKVAEERAQSIEREQILGDFLGRVATQGQRIDNHFLRYEGLLEGLTAATEQVLAHGEPLNIATYHALDYTRPETSPPGTTYSAAYKKNISPDWPVYAYALDTPEDVWRRDLAVLNNLIEPLRNLFTIHPDGSAGPRDPAAQRALILSDKVSIVWGYVALERSGVMYMFPGAPGWDLAYDPRSRPWYRQAKEAWDAGSTRRRYWTRPYVDLMGQGRLISCIQAVTDTEGKLLGVSGLDLGFSYVIDNYMRMSDSPEYVAAFLLDEEGRVIIKSEAKDDPYTIPATEVLDEGLDFGLFDQPEVVASVRQKQSGYLRTEDSKVLAWSRLQHIGWTYVVLGNIGALGP